MRRATICSYELDNARVQTIWMPRSARIIGVYEGAGETPVVCLRALVEPSEPRARCFEMHVDGDQVADPQGVEFIGTVVRSGTSFAVHIFERVAQPRASAPPAELHVAS